MPITRHHADHTTPPSFEEREFAKFENGSILALDWPPHHCDMLALRYSWGEVHNMGFVKHNGVREMYKLGKVCTATEIPKVF